MGSLAMSKGKDLSLIPDRLAICPTCLGKGQVEDNLSQTGGDQDALRNKEMAIGVGTPIAQGAEVPTLEPSSSVENSLGAVYAEAFKSLSLSFGDERHLCGLHAVADQAVRESESNEKKAIQEAMKQYHIASDLRKELEEIRTNKLFGESQSNSVDPMFTLDSCVANIQQACKLNLSEIQHMDLREVIRAYRTEWLASPVTQDLLHYTNLANEGRDEMNLSRKELNTRIKRALEEVHNMNKEMVELEAQLSLATTRADSAESYINSLCKCAEVDSAQFPAWVASRAVPDALARAERAEKLLANVKYVFSENKELVDYIDVSIEVAAREETK